MKYIIDGSFLYGHIKGVQRYARQITKELDKYMADKPYEVEIAVPEIDSEGTSAEINSYKTHYNNIKIVILAGKSGRMWEQFTFQRYVDKQKAKPVYLCNEVSLFMKNGIVTVHDIAFKTHKEFFREPGDWHEILFRKLMYLKAFKSADAIITVSGFSRKEIIDNYNTHGKEIVVAGNGWQHFDVNSIEKLGNVVAIGYARDSEARALMKYCKAFLFPSTYEGFGIPPMEALCMGAEIVLGDIPVLHEIYKNAATYVNCHKPDVNIDELLEKNKVSDEAVQNVLSNHSWDRSAHIIAGIMDKYAE